jgi:hypothetical protein
MYITIVIFALFTNGSVEYIVTTLDIFVFANHLKMAAKRGQNM